MRLNSNTSEHVGRTSVRPRNVDGLKFVTRLATMAALLMLALVATPRGRTGDVFVAAAVEQACGAGIGWRVAGQFQTDFIIRETVAADFNRDGKPDLAFVESNSFGFTPAISVALGDGQGSFQIFSRVELLGSPNSLKVGDFNGDGNPDLFFQGYRSGISDAIAVLAGTGDGRFALRNVANTSGTVSDFALADFNGDGRLDVAISSGQSSTSLRLAFGNLSGGFSSLSQPVSLSASPFNLSAADFNGDGKADLAVTLSPNSKLALLLGNGNGNFTEMAGPVTRESVRSFQVADVNNDLTPDLIVSESFGTLEIFNGDGRGGFGSPKRFITANTPLVRTGDFSGDGKTDLALLSGAVSLLVNDGMGGFTPSETFAAGSAPASLVAGDFNRDGKLDLAAHQSQQREVSILLNAGESRFVAPAIFGVNAINSLLLTADLNRDGRQDVIFADGSFSGFGVALGNGRGGFGAPTNYNQFFSSGLIAMAAADFNQDGNTDLAAAVTGSSSATVILLAADNSGTYSTLRSRRFTVGAAVSDLTAADFNGDGRMDLATANPLANEVLLLLNDGRGGLAAPLSLGVGIEPRSPAAADFNRDGKMDLVTANRNSATMSLLLNNGPAGFESRLIGVGANPRLVKTADFNHDGKPDLIVPHNNSESVSVLLGDGNGGFATPVTTNVGVLPAALAFADFNLDGRLDLALTGLNLPDVRIFHGDGAGKFAAAGQVPAPQAGLVNVADLNGDGLTDLLTVTRANFGTGLSLTQGQCNALPAGITTASAASFHRLQLAADSIVAAFGANLSAATMSANGLPLPTDLAGTGVMVKDSAGAERLAPLFFVSPTQINYLLPKGTAAGLATITVAGSRGMVSGTSQIAAVAPGLFAANANGRGAASAVILRVKPDGRRIYQPAVQFDAAQNQFVPLPIDLGVRPENFNDDVYLILFGTGIRGRGSLSGVEIMIGNRFLDAFYAGSVDGFAGLDQINVQLTGSGLQRGESDVRLAVDGQLGNSVRISIL